MFKNFGGEKQTLYRFLIATDQDVTKAFQKIQKTFKFKLSLEMFSDSWTGGELINLSSDETDIIYWREGTELVRVWIVDEIKTKFKSYPREEIKKRFCAILEKGLQRQNILNEQFGQEETEQQNFEQIEEVVNICNKSLWFCVKNIFLVKELCKIANNHYPETMSRVTVVYRTDWQLYCIKAALNLLVSKRVKKKIYFTKETGLSRASRQEREQAASVFSSHSSSSYNPFSDLSPPF